MADPTPPDRSPLALLEPERSRAEGARRAARVELGRPLVVTRTIAVLAVAAVSLILIQLLKRGGEAQWLVGTLDGIGVDGVALDLDEALRSSEQRSLYRLVLWSLVQIAGYVVLPVILITAVFGERLADYGVRLRGGASIYAVLFAAILPVVLLVSFTDAFQDTYPFLTVAPGESPWPEMLIWWVLYAAQFAALEFFFRGFLLHGLVPAFGYGAIAVMVIPYFLIHLQKPMLEALGAIVAGFVLGHLALRTGTIWWGAALHIAVALTMDVSSMAHRGLL